MDENTTLIRMCYRASDVQIVAQQNNAVLWQLQHTYPNHQTWLHQVYRTLIENDQSMACLHEISTHVPSSTWQSVCDATIAARTLITPRIWAHLVCIDSNELLHTSVQWIRHTATRYAASGQRINGILSPANEHYVNFLLHRDSCLLSGACFGHDGIMMHNGCLASERILANFWITHTTPQHVVPVS